MGGAHAGRSRARRAARPHGGQAAAARAHAARAPARRRSPPRAPPAPARALRPRRAGGGRAPRGRRGPPVAAPRRPLSALRVGTRGSALALAQARWVADRLPDADIVEITTSGDRARGVGDKSRWVDTIEAALVAGDIDLAVHSAKDVPGDLAEGCEIVATPPRASPLDVMVGDGSADAAQVDQLRAGARVGTSSLRRRAQLLSLRPDLDVVELRGNVDTRLRK